ncbi:MAG TPA: VCBS repeat-containing protein [Polyangia bacterium]|nr:VCBS repeat-containing protein [Polyangia bacterium]
MNMLDLNEHWTDAEFNVVGNGGGSQIAFNQGSTLAVQVLTSSVVPSTAAPSCGGDGTTGETNSLNLVLTSCCPIGGASPGIQFMESNVPGQTAPACAQEAVQQPSLLWWNPNSGEVTGWVVNLNGAVPRTENLSWQCTEASGCASAWSPMSTMANNIFWWNRTTGEVATWVIDAEGNVTSPGSLSQTCGGSCASTWTFLGGVMEGTQPGVLWYNNTNGQLELWNYSGTTFTGSQILNWTCGSDCAANWVPIETGDINNDGYSDLIWQNPTTGVIEAWLLQGANVIGTQQLSWTCSKSNGCWTTWWIIGVVDMNGDGLADVSWYNEPTGEVSTWLLDGSGNVTGTQTLNKTCGGSYDTGCASTQIPVGYVNFP